MKRTQFFAIFTGLLLWGAMSSFGQPQSVTLNSDPTRVLGHAVRELVTAGPNFIEGRELTTPQGAVLDTTSNPPILYVADAGNNRVLAWKNPFGLGNAAKADLVIGQRDINRTRANGPGTDFTTGLNSPTGLAVDSQGNLYVADSNNNRIVRYPRPFDQPTDNFLQIDLMIGQETFGSANTGTSGRQPNRGRSTPSASTVYFSDLGTNVFRVRMTFDPAGNLWVSDAGNNRVLRYPANKLQPGNFGFDADVVLGQLDFNTATGFNGDPRDKTKINAPSGIAAAPDGRLYVCDTVAGRGRVLVFRNPTTNAVSADRILGLVVLQQGQATPPRVNDVGLGSPEAVLVVGNAPVVVDAANNRIVRYNTPDTWPPEATQFSPSMRDVVGQSDFNTGDANRAQAAANGLGFNLPVDAIFSNNNLMVVDANNHRVLNFTGNFPFSSTANRVFGQLDVPYNGANLAENKGFFFSGVSLNRFVRGGSIAVDGNILYVADTVNHRILGFRDVRSVALGKPADLVIGQVDFNYTLPNSPTANLNIPNQTGLYFPHAVAVDKNGDLYVADSGNSRVIRFPKPFDNAANLRPNLVIGQANFFSKITDTSSRNLSFPVGLAFTTGGHLLVTDQLQNRVLFFFRPTGGDFTNGQASTIVFGQSDFTSSQSGDASTNRMNNPRGISVDVDDRLYVVDSGNNRILIYNRAPQAGIDPTPAFVLGGFNGPVGATSDPRTGELWVTDGNNNRVLRFPAFGNLTVNTQPNLAVSALFPVDVKTDANSNLIVADSSNRVAFYYQAQSSINAANFQNVPAPGTITSMFSRGGSFTDATVVASTSPLPRELGDTQVLLNDQPVPLFFVSPNQINYQVPYSAIPGSKPELVVLRKSTGQVLAAGILDPFREVSPAFFTSTSTGRGQVSALNEDNTVNGPTNAISRGKVIQIYGTGLGNVSGNPGDGNPAPSDRIINGDKPDVFLAGVQVPAANVLFSGLAPGFIGVWQLNIKIPDTVAPSNTVSLLVSLRSVASQNQLGTIIAVKQ